MPSAAKACRPPTPQSAARFRHHPFCNEYLSANIVTHLIYDDDIDIPVDENGDGVFDSAGPRVQFMEMFGVGLSLKF